MGRNAMLLRSGLEDRDEKCEQNRKHYPTATRTFSRAVQKSGGSGLHDAAILRRLAKLEMLGLFHFTSTCRASATECVTDTLDSNARKRTRTDGPFHEHTLCQTFSLVSLP